MASQEEANKGGFHVSPKRFSRPALTVNEARPREERPPGGGGGGGTVAAAERGGGGERRGGGGGGGGGGGYRDRR